MGGSQVGPLARRVDRRLQHGDSLLLSSPVPAITLRRRSGQCEDMSPLQRSKGFPFQHGADAMPRQRTFQRVAAPIENRGVGAVVEIEGGELVEADDAVESLGGRDGKS